MTEERPSAGSAIDEYVAQLKAIVPLADHGAVDSRLEELLNDSSADKEDVISILRQEFELDSQ